MTTTRKVNALTLVGDIQAGDVVVGERTNGTTVRMTYTGASATLADGDKGDITVSASGAVWTIDDDAVTYAKIQNISATDTLLGRSSSGAGNVEEIVCTAAGRALIDDATSGDQRTTLGLGTLATQSGTFSGTSSGTNTGDQTISLTGDVTGSGTGSFAASIATSAVTLSKMADVVTSSVFYRKTAGTGVPEVQTLATLKTDLGLSGDNSGDQYTFKTISVAGQSDVVAEDLADTLTLVAGSNVTITTNAGTDTVTIAAAGGLSDADYGDITVSGGGTVFTIDAGTVTLAKQADMATASVVYRKTAGPGAPEVQSLATLKTDLGLTGTNSGDQTSIVGITGTKAQFDTAVTDGDILYVGDVTQYTDEMAQDAVGAMVDTSLTYGDGTPLLQRAALTGDVTALAGSNTTTVALPSSATVATDDKVYIFDTSASDAKKYVTAQSIANLAPSSMDYGKTYIIASGVF